MFLRRFLFSFPLYTPMRQPTPLIALTLSVLSLTASAGMAVSPGIVDKQLTAGDNVIELVVSNNSTRPMDIQLYAGPMALTLEGSAIAGESASDMDATPLIRFEKESFVLGPRRWRRVRAQLTAPNRGGGLHGFIYVRGSEANLDPAAKVKVNMQLAVVLTLTLPGEARRSAELVELKTSARGARVRVRNTGNIHLRPEGKVVLFDSAGAQVWSGQLVTGAVLPGSEREYRIEPLPLLPSGQYSAQVELTSPTPARLARTLAMVEGTLVVSAEAKSR